VSLDSLRSRVLQIVSSILQHHDALPMLSYQLANSRRRLQSVRSTRASQATGDSPGLGRASPQSTAELKRSSRLVDRLR
jgi:hypothetical protein